MYSGYRPLCSAVDGGGWITTLVLGLCYWACFSISLPHISCNLLLSVVVAFFWRGDMLLSILHRLSIALYLLFRTPLRFGGRRLLLQLRAFLLPVGTVALRASFFYRDGGRRGTF
jgi:hypothetical protein